MSIPNLAEARSVQAKITALGIPDVKLFYDPTITPPKGVQGMWAVCQSKKVPNQILTMDNQNMQKTESSIMFWCKNASDGTYRCPSDQDVSDVVAIVTRAQVTFHKGSDWMLKQLDDEKEARRAMKDKRLHDRLHPHIKELRKAIRREGLT